MTDPRAGAAAALGLLSLATLAGCATVEAKVHEPKPAVEIAYGGDDSAPKTLLHSSSLRLRPATSHA